MSNNVEYAIKGDKLTITVDLSQRSISNAPPSSSGKTKLVASTSGYAGIGTVHGKALSLAVNVTAK